MQPKPPSPNRRSERINPEQLFRGLLESASDAIVVVNQEDHIVLVNSQTENLFGYQREELISREVEMLVPASFREKTPRTPG